MSNRRNCTQSILLTVPFPKTAINCLPIQRLFFPAAAFAQVHFLAIFFSSGPFSYVYVVRICVPYCLSKSSGELATEQHHYLRLPSAHFQMLESELAQKDGREMGLESRAYSLARSLAWAGWLSAFSRRLSSDRQRAIESMQILWRPRTKTL